MSTSPVTTLPEDSVHSGSTGKEHRGPGDLPVSTAPTRSRTNLVTQTPRGGLIGTPGASFQSYPVLNPAQPAVRRQARREGDAGAIPANPSPLGQDRAVAGNVRKALNPWLLLASLAGTIGIAVLCVIFWPTARNSHSPASAALAMRASAELSTSQQRDELPDDPGAALTTAIDHLGAALDEVAEGSPEEILRKVSTPGRDCGMVWANDSPSLVFGRYPIRGNSIAHTLEACAQAVSRMH
jgi:hypothetical protein